VTEEQIPIYELDAKEDISYQQYPIKVLEMTKLRETRRSRCARCNGVTISTKRLLGKEKKVKSRVSKFLF
jgi:hypothetical protein